jgi:hypothetical protein
MHGVWDRYVQFVGKSFESYRMLRGGSQIQTRSLPDENLTSFTWWALLEVDSPLLITPLGNKSD